MVIRRSVGRFALTVRRAFQVLAALSVLGPALAGPAAAESQADAAAREEFPWRVGVARTVITPGTGVWLAGYGTKRPPDGKLHDLWAKALALETPDGRRAVLITSDFQGVPKIMSDRVFEKLRAAHKLERSQVMFTFSHNHCGPRLGDDLVDYYPVEAEQVRLVEEYTAAMVDKVVDLVGASLDALAPARIQTGRGSATFAVNRRNNVEAEVPALLKQGKPLAGPVDHSVPVLTVERPGGALAAILFGYACHPTTLSFNTYCGDYPGFAQIALEKNHPGATALFVNTCGADQGPMPRRTVEFCEQYGRMLADGVETALKGPSTTIEPVLRTAFELVELPYLKVATRDDLAASLKGDNEILRRWAARLLAKLDAGETFAPSHPYPVHVWRLGADTLMIGLGAETVVDYALRFKREFGGSAWVCGYTDDMLAYIPSRRVWEEGGYEGGSRLYEYGRPAYRWAGDVEDRIAAAVHRLAKQVRD